MISADTGSSWQNDFVMDTDEVGSGSYRAFYEQSDGTVLVAYGKSGLMRYVPNNITLPCQDNTTNLSASICSNEVYDFAGQSLTAAGIYGDTLTNSAGCDSLVVFGFEGILPNDTRTFTASICSNEAYTLLAKASRRRAFMVIRSPTRRAVIAWLFWT